jgi:hypothetical protein
MNRALFISLICIASFLPAAPGTHPSPTALARSKALKANLKSFELHLGYNGDADKPYYGLTLSVAPVIQTRTNPFGPSAQITEDQAAKIVDLLATQGFLDRAINAANKNVAAPPSPSYTMSVFHKEDVVQHEFYDVLGWDLAMLARLDALRALLDGDAARDMDLLLDRLSGHRRQWEEAHAR